MHPWSPNSRAPASVLDRLLDDEPKKTEEAPQTRSQSVRNYKNAVRRDLEWLLNTRCTLPEMDEDHDALQASVYTYGLPDFNSYGAGSAQTRSKLVRALRRAIATFEPRLSNVEVALVESEDEKNILRFLISGLLRMEPTSEPVTYDTKLDVSKGAYSVLEG